MADSTTHVSAQQQAVAVKSAEDLRKAQEAAVRSGAAGVDARLKARDEQVRANEERSSYHQPTPTQRENDLARVGALNIDEKEDDGSEWQDEHDVRVATEKLSNPYETRDVEATAARKAARTSKRSARKR